MKPKEKKWFKEFEESSNKFLKNLKSMNKNNTTLAEAKMLEKISKKIEEKIKEI